MMMSMMRVMMTDDDSDDVVMIIVVMIIVMIVNTHQSILSLPPFFTHLPENPEVHAASNTAMKPEVVFACLSPPSLPLVESCAIDTPIVRMTREIH